MFVRIEKMTRKNILKQLQSGMWYVTESEFLNSGVVGAFEFNVARDGEFNDASRDDCKKVIVLKSGVVGAFDFNVARDGEFNDTSADNCTTVSEL